MSLKNVASSDNLIDFASPSQSNVGLIKPLIPESNLLFQSSPRESIGSNNPFDEVFKTTKNPLISDSNVGFPLSPRDSIGPNNPFDEVFKAAKNMKHDYIDDPFESVCAKAKQYDDVKVKVNDEHTPEDDGDSSLGILDESMILNDSLTTSEVFKITPGLLQSTDQEIRDSIAQRVSRCIEQASPCPRINQSYDLKRSHSNSQLGTSNQYSSISDTQQSSGAYSSLNRGGFLATASTFEQYDSSENRFDDNFDKAFPENLQRRPSYNSQHSFVGRKSLSARKPTKYELDTLERCRLMNYSANIFNFRERLKMLDGEDDLKQEDSNDSEFPKTPETFSSNNNISAAQDKIIEDTETHVFTCKESNNHQIFKGAEQVFPLKTMDDSQDIKEADIKEKNNLNSSENQKPRKQQLNHSKKWKKDTIKVLENLIKVLKTDSDNDDATPSDSNFGEEILRNVAQMIHKKQQQEDLESTASCNSSDEFVEVQHAPEPKVVSSQQRLPMRKSYSFSNGLRKPSVPVVDVDQNEIEPQSLKNLRPKHAISEVGKKGPLKAVIPIDIMTKDSAAATSKMHENPKTRVIPSSPKTENVSKLKPVAQSTPTNSTNSKLKGRKSSIGVSPISRFSSSSGRKNDHDALNTTFSPPPSKSNTGGSCSRPSRKLTSVQSSSALSATKQQQQKTSQMLTRRRSASELKVPLDKKLMDSQTRGSGIKSKMTALRPLNSLISKMYRSSSGTGGNTVGKENDRFN